MAGGMSRIAALGGRIARDTTGASAVEYAVLIGLVALGGAKALGALGVTMASNANGTTNQLKNYTASSTSGGSGTTTTTSSGSSGGSTSGNGNTSSTSTSGGTTPDVPAALAPTPDQPPVAAMTVPTQ